MDKLDESNDFDNCRDYILGKQAIAREQWVHADLQYGPACPMW